MRAIAPLLPRSRVRALRTLVYLFIPLDVLLLNRSVLGLAATPEYYRPLLAARLLHLPPITAPIAWTLLGLVLAGCVLALTGRRQRGAGVVVAVAFSLWMFYADGYGYVAHDHMPLMIAAWALPTAPAARWDEDEPDERSGWVLLVVQLAVVATYAVSVLSKIEYSGSAAAWANSSILAWAFLRRGTPLAAWLLEHGGWMLVPAQWASLVLELLAPLALFLHGRALAVMISGFVLFHLGTLVTLGIHFAPVVLCWAAFLPIERLRSTRLGRRLASRSPVTAESFSIQA